MTAPLVAVTRGGRPGRAGLPGRPTGFTLIEVVVVLALMGLGAALVAPALLSDAREPRGSLQGVIMELQRLAARRSETLSLEVSDQGSWSAYGTAERGEPPLGSGRVTDARAGQSFVLRISPIGSCAFPLDAEGRVGLPAIDPLTCTVLPR